GAGDRGSVRIGRTRRPAPRLTPDRASRFHTLVPVNSNSVAETTTMPPVKTTATVLLAETQGEVARLTLNPPHPPTALSHELRRALDAALARIADDRGVRAVVIAANGPVFCAGHDISEMVGQSAEDYRGLFALCSAVMVRLRRLPQPVIARVQGLAT